MNNRLGALLFALLAICLFFTFQDSDFLGARNLTYLMVEFAITATLAVGMLLVILPGHIDLSAGSGVGLTGGLAAVAAAHRLGIGAWIVVPLETCERWTRGLAEWCGVAWLHALAGWFAASAAELNSTFVDLFAMHPNLKAPLAMVGACIVALFLWRFMGRLIVRQRIPAFIITLGGLLIFKGLFWMVIRSQTVPVGGATGTVARQVSITLPAEYWARTVPIFEYAGDAFTALTTGYFLPAGAWFIAGVFALWMVLLDLRGRSVRLANGLGVADGEVTFLRLFCAVQLIVLLVLITTQFRGLPLPVVILTVVAVFVWLKTQHTPWGRHLYAVGGNEEAAIVSGIPVERVVTGAFMLMGGIVALTGLMQTAYQGSSTTTVGELMELDAVAACVIGGTSLRGGRGSVLGVLFGALIMACLINGLTLISALPEKKLIARGVVLVAAVWLDVKLARRVR